MNKTEFIEQIEFFYNEIRDYNYISSIITSDDRDNKKIDMLKDEIDDAASNGVLNIQSALSLKLILTYFQFLNKGIALTLSIMFQSGNVWNVEFSTSERSDRTEGLEARVSRNRSNKNYIVIEEYGNGKFRKRPKVGIGNTVSVVSLEEFVDDLLYEIYSFEKNGKKKIPMSKSPMSKINNKRGVFWEKCIAESMRQQGKFMPDLYDQIIRIIMRDEKFTEQDIKKIKAENVGTKGEKTDVSIEIELLTGTIITKNISAKASLQDQVSLHQAKALDFVAQLGIKDKRVIDALEKFQKYGNTSGMTDDDEKALVDFFGQQTEYKKLLDWCFKGATSKVDYILIHSYDREDNWVAGHTKIYSITDYMDEVKAKRQNKDAGFGTGLIWTYKSVKTKKKEKRNEIQLKVPLIEID